MARPRILSGIKPTGKLHIGNYFGMMRPAIEWQERGEAFYFVADYHALTTVRDPQALRRYSEDVALDFLACGLDPDKATLFRQSDIAGLAELAWILSCLTPMPMLENCHAYKDHLAKQLVPSHGVFAYPTLMAADILMYDSNIVPVGRDQKQHVEVTRDLAQKLNASYGEILVVPEASIVPQVATVPGVDGRKMSKSYGNAIELFLDEKTLRKTIMGIVTDSTPVAAPKDPANSSIFALYSLFATPPQVQQMEVEFRAGGVGYGDFKKRLFEAVWEYFAPMRARREGLLRDRGAVQEVLRRGCERAGEIAGQTMGRVRAAVGLS
jgi:tryptophanyl-tRNA synthetase